MLGDFYRVLPYRATADVWAAWQWHRPDLGEGAIFVFRRHESPYRSAVLPLSGLAPGATYRVWRIDQDAGDAVELAGRELMKSGPPVTLDERPDSVILRYRQIV